MHGISERSKNDSPRLQNVRGTKGNAQTPGYSHPGGPAIGTSLVMPPRSFASPAGTARTTRTRRKRRRNVADLPFSGKINRSYSPKPPMHADACHVLLEQENPDASRRVSAMCKNRSLTEFVDFPCPGNFLLLQEVSKAHIQRCCNCCGDWCCFYCLI